MRIRRTLGVPALLEIPIVLENLANTFLLAGQDCQQVHLKHGIPHPLAIESIARAGLQPAVFQGAFGRPDLAQDTMPEHILRHAEEIRVARFEKRLDVDGLVFAGGPGFPGQAGQQDGACRRSQSCVNISSSFHRTTSLLPDLMFSFHPCAPVRAWVARKLLFG